MNRRSFIHLSGVGTLPVVAGKWPMPSKEKTAETELPTISFVRDGPGLTPLHLDGARLHLASSWSDISVREYASLFDTVYMCLYKYLGAGSGAVLCGSKETIAPMEHLVKVHGGAMYQNWTNASMALYHLQGIDQRLSATRQKWEGLMKTLNGIEGIQIDPVPNGCNIFHLRTSPGYELKKLTATLHGYAIKIALPDEQDGTIHMHINETLLLQDAASIVTAFSAAAAKAKVSTQ